MSLLVENHVFFEAHHRGRTSRRLRRQKVTIYASAPMAFNRPIGALVALLLFGLLYVGRSTAAADAIGRRDAIIRRVAADNSPDNANRERVFGTETFARTKAVLCGEVDGVA